MNALRKYGVKTDFISRGGDRVGIYYLETGASMRPSKVIYGPGCPSGGTAGSPPSDSPAC